MSFVPRGIIVPIVTPITPEGLFERRTLGRLVERLIAGGVHGIFPGGTTGEFYGFTVEEKKVIFLATVQHPHAGNGSVGLQRRPLA